MKKLIPLIIITMLPAIAFTRIYPEYSNSYTESDSASFDVKIESKWISINRDSIQVIKYFKHHKIPSDIQKQTKILWSDTKDSTFLIAYKYRDEKFLICKKDNRLSTNLPNTHRVNIKSDSIKSVPIYDDRLFTKLSFRDSSTLNRINSWKEFERDEQIYRASKSRAYYYDELPSEVLIRGNKKMSDRIIELTLKDNKRKISHKSYMYFSILDNRDKKLELTTGENCVGSCEESSNANLRKKSKYLIHANWLKSEAKYSIDNDSDDETNRFFYGLSGQYIKEGNSEEIWISGAWLNADVAYAVESYIPYGKGKKCESIDDLTMCVEFIKSAYEKNAKMK